MKITYGSNVYNLKEINAVNKVLKKTTQMGNSVIKFEKEISKIFNKKKTLMVNSGSSALLIAFSILDFPKGSNFITPVLNFGTAVSAIFQNGYIPNYVDVKINTFCINEDLIENSITKKTVGLLIPNLLGNLPDWNKIKKIANKYKLFIIEDSADTLGSRYNNKSSGYYSDISICSYYGSHIISCAGNGGSLSLNDLNFSKKALLKRSWGRSSSMLTNSESENTKNRFNLVLDNIDYDKKFVFETLGYNFEPSEIGAAFGLEQLKKLKNNIKIRQRNFNEHIKYVNKRSNIFIKPNINNKVFSAWLAFPLILKENLNFSRKNLMIFLEKNKVQTRVVFTGNILRQPGFKNLKSIKQKKYLNADYIMKNSFLVGLHQGLNFKNIQQIHYFIDKFLKKHTYL